MLMRISDGVIVELLHRSRKLNDEQFKNLLEQQKTEQKPLQELALKANLISEKELTQLYGAQMDVPFVELIPKNIRREVLKLIPERVARQYKAVLFDVREDGSHLLAMEDPDDVQALNFLQKQLGTNIRVYVATRSNILAALDQYRGNISSELTEVIATDSSATGAEAEKEIKAEDLAEDSPIAQTVNLIIQDAIKQGASDIHIEPRENLVSIRYRIDGQLRETNKIPKKLILSLITLIKIF